MDVEACWAAFCLETGRAVGEGARVVAFGAGKAQQDELCGLALMGRKRGTASLALWYERDGAVKPAVGDLGVLVDGSGEGRGVTEVLEVVERAFGAVDAAFALVEGEGDGSLGYWRAEHERFFAAELAEVGLGFDEAMVVVCERFEVVWRVAQPVGSVDGLRIANPSCGVVVLGLEE